MREERTHEGGSGPAYGVAHAVFAEGAWEALRDAAAAVATCNTVLHPTNAIDTSDLIAEALAELRALAIEEPAP